MPRPTSENLRRLFLALLAGASVGTLGGLIGLGGAEFRLPLLIGLFGFVALEAVIINKAVSLVVVASALGFRSAVIPMSELLQHWSILANLLVGSLAGAWLGADFATRLRARTLYRIIASLLLVIAVVLIQTHDVAGSGRAVANGGTMIAIGLFAGLIIGAIASLLGVAGGEFLIPTLVLLFGIDVKLAGSLSLAISFPTMLVGFARYSRDRSFTVVLENRRFLLVMAIGSLLGTFCGAMLLPRVASAWLLPILALILVLSAVKIWRQH